VFLVCKANSMTGIDGSFANYSEGSGAVRVSGQPSKGRARGPSAEETSPGRRAGSGPSVEPDQVSIPGQEGVTFFALKSFSQPNTDLPPKAGEDARSIAK
jgi:hypothetical protein